MACPLKRLSTLGCVDTVVVVCRLSSEPSAVVHICNQETRQDRELMAGLGYLQGTSLRGRTFEVSPYWREESRPAHSAEKERTLAVR